MKYFLLIVLLCLSRISASNGQESPARETYPARVAAIEQARKKFAARWEGADKTQQAAILVEVRAFLEKSITGELFPCWMGTPWDFNGITQKPGEGAIACGYFVSTVLRDAGFRIERAKLGQQASQVIIKTMTPADQIKVTSNSSMKNMEEVFKNRVMACMWWDWTATRAS